MKWNKELNETEKIVEKVFFFFLFFWKFWTSEKVSARILKLLIVCELDSSKVP